MTSSTRPYLLRALNEWIVDNGLTPYIVVDTRNENMIVPLQHIQDHRITLNIAPSAVQQLSLSNDEVTFSARFQGKAMNIFIPVEAITAIYAQESGQGMVFSEGEITESADPESPQSSRKPAKKSPKPNLHLVK